MYDYIIVGAGLFGSVIAYRAHKQGKKVLVIDKRNHIAGNVYTEKVEGIPVHKYGAHIFHTDYQDVNLIDIQIAQLQDIKTKYIICHLI